MIAAAGNELLIRIAAFHGGRQHIEAQLHKIYAVMQVRQQVINGVFQMITACK